MVDRILPTWFARLATTFGIACLTAILLLHMPARADLREPAWWDPDGVGVGQDWHYRIPVTLPPNSAIDNVATVDIDFAAQLALLGVNSGSSGFNPSSVRVVRPNGTLALVQEFTRTRYNGITNNIAFPRGEIRWIVEDPGAATYYIYFDITQNGTKSANPQLPINGNFEHSGAIGVSSPRGGWTGNRRFNVTGSYDAQATNSRSVTVTTDGSVISAADGPTLVTDGTSATGTFHYLLGARTMNEFASTPFPDGGFAQLRRTIRVPATNPGQLNIRVKPQGWGAGIDDPATAGDYLQILIGGNTVFGARSGLFNYSTVPFSPNFGTQIATTTRSGFGQYNGFNNNSLGTGGTLPFRSQNYYTISVDLSPYAGRSVELLFFTNHILQYKSWFLIDDVEWSLVPATVGAVQAFGANITVPDDTTPILLTNRQRFPPIQVRVDANPLAASPAVPVIAELYDDSAVLRGTATLLNDGLHGDGAANDAIWGNDGSDTNFPLPTIPANVINPSINWTVRITARDQSTSSISVANNGRLHRAGQPNEPTQANYWNIDQRTFIVIPPDVRVTKTAMVLSDPISSSNFKNIPGAIVQYCMTIRNNGLTASNIIATDNLPSDVTYRPNSMRSGGSCGTAMTVEDDDATDGGETDGITASYNAGANTVTVNRSTLDGGVEFALTFEVQVD